ncbi:hypothetical protein ACHAWO_009126 [Cyclotella atomus]|uniref:Vacuolar protein 8 n=1 Tax=Cyclotella atomus TaxID=382360 RepID=A0ABD3PN38_9STRA
MSKVKVLESLVARGRRRGNSYKDQREITYGLADLSTQKECHERLVKKSGVSTLVDILISSQDAEAQQFAAIAVANTSSTTSLASDIVQLEGAVEGIVKYTGNEAADSTGRQYCAMALGNLLADQSTHERIVELGVITALITMLKNCTDGRELESGRHTAFALSNLASNSTYHVEIVEQGAIELLVALACCEDIDTQRQAISALRGLCLTSSNRTKVVQKGILDPLILVSTCDEVEMVREVSSALNCISSIDENKEEISYRAISTLIHLMLSGDTEIERHASSAIANLMEMSDIHPRFVEEKGLPALVSLCCSSDQVCRIEATRAVANLSSNPGMIDALIGENSLLPLVKSLEIDGNKGQYSALAIANFATNASSLFKIVQAGAVPRLVSVISNVDNIHCKRYGALAIANITACETFHSPIMAAGAPTSLFALTNSCDALSNRYIACVLANLSSNTANHEQIVEMGGLQPLITLVNDPDPTIHKQAAAALRGLSATGNTKMKIVQEGGLEPLCRLLLSKDDLILHEVTACLCNVSLADENKYELVKESRAVEHLIDLMESEDAIVSSQACECLANLAEMTENQDFIVREEAITPCINAMRSRHVEVQRESSRLIANLSASESTVAVDAIIEGNGHLVLTSFLLSQDTACQRAASFGIGNLCTHDHRRVTLTKAGVLEPLTSLTRSESNEIEIRRFSMLAIANLAANPKTHDEFVSQGTIPMLISFSNSADTEMRNYAAYAVAQLSKNSDLMDIITSEGGLEAVLYLGRSDDKTVQREVLPALTTLSFMDSNKVPICSNGSLPPIIDFINEAKNSSAESNLACCAVANLVEASSNMQPSINHGCVPLLVDALASNSENVQREAARSIGNLAVNIDHSDEILRHAMVVPRLVACFRGRNVECQRMAAYAISNVSTNIKSHDELLKNGIVSLIENECQASLDPKRFSDQETVRSCLLIIGNLTGNKLNHPSMGIFFDFLMDFTRHRDAMCRQHAILAVGNLCSEPENAKHLISVKCMEALVAFAFPPTTDGSINAQFQAIAGLHGLSKLARMRKVILAEGGLEPLILGARGNNRHQDIEIQREAASTISNLALEAKNRLTIAKSGALPALVTLTKSSNTMCIYHSVTALANLAESSEETHDLLISAQSISPMCALVHNPSTHVDIKRAISRCFSLFASNEMAHSMILSTEVTSSIRSLICESRDSICQRFGALAVSNFALVEANHGTIRASNMLESTVSLATSLDIETLRGLSFAIHSLSCKDDNHSALEEAGAIESLIPLLQCEDRDTMLQACLAVKYLSTCDKCRIKFVEKDGLGPLLALSTSHDLETKRELGAALRNLTLSDENKIPIMTSGIDFIATLCRDTDDEVSHQACGIVANISEKQENKAPMVEKGIIHHLQAAMSISESIPVLRESVRAFASLSSAIENTAQLISSGALSSLIRALNANDLLCRRFAAMALSNLAVNTELHGRIIHEVGIPLLMLVGRQGNRDFIDAKAHQHGMAFLANLASCNESHGNLMSHNCSELAVEHIKSSDLDLRRNALLLLANLASNKANHSVLEKCCKMSKLIENLECQDSTVQLNAVTCLRGLSTDISLRKRIISDGGTEALLSLVHSDDEVFKVEILSTLCNLSLGGCMGDRANTVLEKIDMRSLISFLCNGDSTTHRMFGSVAIGNIASDVNLQAPIFDSGAVKSLIELSDKKEQDQESQRCMAYAVCNLSAETRNRMSIITQGGLASIMYLCRTRDISDMLAALSTLRGLSACDEARRLILEEGVLHVLLLGVKSGNLQCKREAASILASLSLNEENKFDIARSDEMKEMISLLNESDALCISNTCRSLGNICEVKELHNDVLSLLTIRRLVLLTSPCTELEVKREAARCTANLSSNFGVHENLVLVELLENICKLCSNAMADVHSNGETPDQMDVIRLSILTLANVCMNAEMHARLDMKSLLSVFYQVVQWDCLSQDTMSEAKCNACMGLSALCTYPSTASFLVELKAIPALVECIKSNISELSTHASFVLNKLSMVQSTHSEFGLQEFSAALTGHVDLSNKQCTTYSIASLRRLADDDRIRSGLISIDALDFFTRACEVESEERSREIACCMCHLALWNKAKMPIAESSMLRHIIVLCDSSDVETSRFALGALANLAENIQTHEIVLQHPVIEQMLRLTQNHNIPIVREATRVLANLISSTSTHHVLLKENGMVLLSNVCQIPDNECVHNISVAYCRLAANSVSHESFFTEESINVVIHMTVLEDRKTVLQSAATLRDIASNPEHQLVFVEVGGLKAAIDLAASDAEVGVKIVALEIIRHLSVSMHLKTRILQSGAVNVISSCIENNDHTDLLYQCASSIANLAEHAQNKAALVQMGILRCLVSLHHCDSNEVKKETARALSLLSSAPENNKAFDIHVISVVIDLLACQEEETARDSASTLSNIAANSDQKRIVGNCNGILPLVVQLKSAHESVQIASCKALSRLTDIEENKVSAYVNGGLTLLLHLCSSSSSEELLMAAMMVLVNLSSCAEHQDRFIQEKALVTLKSHLTSKNPALRQYTVMTLCNLSSHDSSIDHVARQIDLLLLIELINEDNSETRSYATMTICNLASKHQHGASVLMAGGLIRLAAILTKPEGSQLQRASLLALYNLSTYQACHGLMVKEEVIKPIIMACRSPDILSRRSALLILANVACNDKTRASATKGGGLQAAVLALKDEDVPTMRFACICLSNMANESNTQSQILVHGGLPSLMALSDMDDSETSECAITCLSNLAANESIHLPLTKQGAFKRFVDAYSGSKQNSVSHLFGIANLTSNAEVLSQIGRGGGIRPLLSLAKSDNLHYQCSAISGLRRLALIRENRDRLISEGIVSILVSNSSKTAETALQREIASCFCNLTLAKNHRADITRTAIGEIAVLSQSSDPETIRLSLGAIANLAEDIETHQHIHTANAVNSAISALGHQELDIKREAARAVTNILSTIDFHPEVVEHGLDSLITLSAESCDECRYLTATSFRKLSTSKVAHHTLIHKKFPIQ